MGVYPPTMHLDRDRVAVIGTLAQTAIRRPHPHRGGSKVVLRCNGITTLTILNARAGFDRPPSWVSTRSPSPDEKEKSHDCESDRHKSDSHQARYQAVADRQAEAVREQRANAFRCASRAARVLNERVRLDRADSRRRRRHSDRRARSTHGGNQARSKRRASHCRERLERRAYTIADNKLAANAGWDANLLALELTTLKKIADSTMEALGFTPAEVNSILKTIDSSALAQLSSAFAYRLVVDCADESVQAHLMTRLEAEGFTCRPLVS